MSMVNPNPQPKSNFSSSEGTNSVVWEFECTSKTATAPSPEIVEVLRRYRLEKETQFKRALEEHKDEVERLKKQLEDQKNSPSGNADQ